MPFQRQTRSTLLVLDIVIYLLNFVVNSRPISIEAFGMQFRSSIDKQLGGRIGKVLRILKQSSKTRGQKRTPNNKRLWAEGRQVSGEISVLLFLEYLT